MEQSTVHDLMLLGMGAIAGGFIVEAIGQLAQVAHNLRQKNKPVDVPLTLPPYYGDRPTTHVERVSAMLDKLEGK